MRWVIDASFACALFLPDERSEEVEIFFNGIGSGEELIIPAVWWSEMANVLVVARRRKRLSDERISEIFSLLEQLEVITDTQEGTGFMRKVFEIAGGFGLSSYDAGYLECASRNKASFATLDRKLYNAAKQMSVPLFKV